MNNNTQNSAVCTVPMIAGVEITTDAEGRFNLNALHKASGAEKKDGPSYWMVLDSTMALIDELKNQTTGNPVVKKEGRYGGTFAHELLAIEYAGWISPAFRLQVNQTFIDYRSGKLAPVQAALPSVKDLALMVIQAEEEKEKLQLENQVLAPKARFHDDVAVAPDAISLSQAAKTLNTGRTRLCSFLRQQGWISRRNEPYQAKINAGLMDVKIGCYNHPINGLQQSITALVTGKGLTKLHDMLTKED